jgi:hypothetical protein
MVTIDNYEEYLMMAADGELDAAAGAQLKAFLLQHPELAAEAESWTSLKLQPDVTVVYEEQEALLRQKPKSIALGWRVSLAAAASVALALVLLTRDRHQDVPRFAHNWSEKAAAPVVKVVPDTALPVASISTIVTPKRTAPIRQQTIKQQSHPIVRTQQELVALNASTVSIPVTASLQPIIQSRQEPVSVNPIASLANLPEASEEAKHRMIHLATANAPAIELIREGVDARVSQISNAVKSIRETSFAVRIGNKNHYLNF